MRYSDYYPEGNIGNPTEVSNRRFVEKLWCLEGTGVKYAGGLLAGEYRNDLLAP